MITHWIAWSFMKSSHEFINLSLLTITQAIENDKYIAAEGDWLNISNAFDVFADSLITHMNDEDSRCYCQASEITNCDPLFYRLISDHMNIRKLIDECQLLIDLNEKQQFFIKFSQLDELIEEHTIREENLMQLNAHDLEASTIQIIKLLRNMHNSQSL